jgi:hypothetical protein
MSVSETLIAKWEPIIDSVPKSNVPTNFVHRLVLKFDGEQLPKQKTININKLKNQGYTIEDIDEIIYHTMYELEPITTKVDLFVDIEAVAEEVQPITNRILKI